MQIQRGLRGLVRGDRHTGKVGREAPALLDITAAHQHSCRLPSQHTVGRHVFPSPEVTCGHVPRFDEETSEVTRRWQQQGRARAPSSRPFLTPGGDETPSPAGLWAQPGLGPGHPGARSPWAGTKCKQETHLGGLVTQPTLACRIRHPVTGQCSSRCALGSHPRVTGGAIPASLGNENTLVPSELGLDLRVALPGFTKRRQQGT